MENIIGYGKVCVAVLESRLPERFSDSLFQKEGKIWRKKKKK